MTKIIKKAIVKLDDTNKTGSTGGVVVDILDFYPDMATNGSVFYNPYNIDNINYKMINCSEKCKVGWIYTDKTNFLIDSNYSTNV